METRRTSDELDVSMKVVFAGPSLWGAAPNTTGLIMRPPAKAGDILDAVRHGATVVGLIDGFFGWTAATWHKEILHALSEGVTVYGAASMGALRAAELHEFGMIPIGSIAGDYISGVLDDDAAVALTSGPEELQYMPLSEPLVDALATIDQMARTGAIDGDQAQHLHRTARRIFFQRRTAEQIVNEATGDEATRACWLAGYERHRVFRKRDDAIALIMAVRRSGGKTGPQSIGPVSAFWHLLDPTNG